MDLAGYLSDAPDSQDAEPQHFSAYLEDVGDAAPNLGDESAHGKAADGGGDGGSGGAGVRPAGVCACSLCGVNGGAEWGPARAVVGGVDYAVGGWGEYEVTRRRARWEASRADPAARARARYPGQSFVGGADAARSVLARAPRVSNRPAPLALGGAKAETGADPGADPGAARGTGTTALRLAATHLASALGRLEDRLCDPDDDGVWECLAAPPRAGVRAPGALRAAACLTVPPVTSADLRAFAADPAAEADPDTLYALSEDVTALVAAAGGRGRALAPLPPLAPRGGHLPPLPARVVPVDDDEGVLRLEAAVAPYVSAVEELQAALASQLEAATAAVGAVLARRAKTESES